MNAASHIMIDERRARVMDARAAAADAKGFAEYMRRLTLPPDE